VRELKNIVERCIVLLEDGKVDPNVIPSHIRNKRNINTENYRERDTKDNSINIPFGMSLKEVERRVINHTLSRVENNKTEAAKILGFTRKTLHNKLETYEENVSSKKSEG
jgi:DNA-binding NtrC family response regulator